ncbi:MAG: NUDIX domain-containing protein [Patescibacteria group bacterium]
MTENDNFDTARFFAAGIALRLNPLTRIDEVLVLEYDRRGKRDRKFPGGNSEAGESPEQALRREFPVESGCQISRAVEVFRKELRTPGRADHDQVFYVVELVDPAEIRTTWQADGEEEQLGPSFWMPVDEALSADGLFRSHRVALQHLVNLVRSRSWFSGVVPTN